MKPSNNLLWRNISELPYFRGFLRAVEGRYFQDIPVLEPVMDLGCGDGHFTAATFSDKEIRFIGFDPEIKFIIQAKKYKAYKQLICSDGDAIPIIDDYFRSVVSNSVLEHIPNVDDVIHELYRVIEPGGRLIITVPNDNFTKNLSVARFLDWIKLGYIANFYRKVFNRISRHYHPDPTEMWLERLKLAGFQINQFWDYFPKESLSILEWGHLFGLPSWVNKNISGRWVLFPYSHNPILALVYQWLKKHVDKDQRSEHGAYSFILATK